MNSFFCFIGVNNNIEKYFLRITLNFLPVRKKYMQLLNELLFYLRQNLQFHLAQQTVKFLTA